MTDQEPKLTEPVPAPEIYTEGYSCIGMGPGVAKFAFFSVNHTSADLPPERRIVLRLVMPFGAVVGIHQALGDFIEALKQQVPIVDTPQATN